MRATDSRAATPQSTHRRSAFERLAVRWPGLMHLTTASVLRLPRGSRVRRTLLERAAEAAYEAWVGDHYQEAARAIADPEIEVYNELGAESPVGMDDVYYGPDGYCQAMADWADSWRSWRVEIEDVVEVAPDKVLITGRHFGEGRASGVPIERWGAVLYTFRRGKIVRVDGYLFSDRDSVSAAVRSIAEGDFAAAAGTSAGP